MKNAQREPNYHWRVMAFLFDIYTITNADRADTSFALAYFHQEFNLSHTSAFFS